MKKLLILLLSLLFLMTACAPQTEPVTDPEPTPPVTEIDPVPVPTPESAKLSYTVGDALKNQVWDGVRVNIITPVLTGENQAALDIINHYYTLLAGKVLDYAEGDLTSASGESYVVKAEYQLTRATENVISLLWQVSTVSAGESPAEFVQSAAVFHAKTGNLYTFSDVFGENTAVVQAMFTEKAREYMKNNPAYYYEHAEDLLETAFDPNNFFYDENAVVVFYNDADLGIFVEARLSYEELDGLLLMKP